MAVRDQTRTVRCLSQSRAYSPVLLYLSWAAQHCRTRSSQFHCQDRTNPFRGRGRVRNRLPELQVLQNPTETTTPLPATVSLSSVGRNLRCDLVLPSLVCGNTRTVEH